MTKYFCDRCGIECKENILTEVAIPKEKSRYGSFSTNRILVCSVCKKEHDKIIDTIIDIHFLMFEKFYDLKGEIHGGDQ